VVFKDLFVGKELDLKKNKRKQSRRDRWFFNHFHMRSNMLENDV
jgi:hypothetical protein